MGRSSCPESLDVFNGFAALAGGNVATPRPYKRGNPVGGVRAHHPDGPVGGRGRISWDGSRAVSAGPSRTSASRSALSAPVTTNRTVRAWLRIGGVRVR